MDLEATVKKLRAMLFEDDPQIRSLVVQYLEIRGYEVFFYAEPHHCPVYTSGPCACEESEACCDILITDIEMPRTSGLDMVEEMQRSGCKTVPQGVVIMSAGWDDERLDRANRLGCHTLSKPFSLGSLGQMLDEFEAQATGAGNYRHLPPTLDPDDTLDD